MCLGMLGIHGLLSTVSMYSRIVKHMQYAMSFCSTLEVLDILVIIDNADAGTYYAWKNPHMLPAVNREGSAWHCTVRKV